MNCVYLDFIINLIFMIIYIMLIIISVAFIILMERKILGLIQWRIGPNKVGAFGLFQPFSDAIKLLSKSLNVIYLDYYMYYFMPLGMFMIMVMVWLIFPIMGISNFMNSILLLISILSLSVYPIMMGSWFSGSMYSYIGCLRSVAQMISYEISFMVLIMCYMIFYGSFSFDYYFFGGFMLFMIPINLFLFFSMLVELNRTPADLVEGESELVSGFNVEFYGHGFTLIFLGEYGMIFSMSYIYTALVLGFNGFTFMGFILMIIILFFIFWFRAVMPRLRYDFLMMVCWTIMLPVGLSYLFMLLGIKSLMCIFY